MILPGRLCRTVLVIRWVCRYTMWPGLCRMIPYASRCTVKYPYLRCTRVLQPRMVLTIEPGIYFIESLLAPWREGPFSKHFNWQKIEALKPFGGIRIEDNVVIHENGVENMTRDLKLA